MIGHGSAVMITALHDPFFTRWHQGKNRVKKYLFKKIKNF